MRGDEESSAPVGRALDLPSPVVTGGGDEEMGASVRSRCRLPVVVVDEPRRSLRRRILMRWPT
jgi:hypothetical protein